MSGWLGRPVAADSESRPKIRIFSLDFCRRPALCCAASALLAAAAPVGWTQETPAQPQQQSQSGDQASNITPYAPAFFAQFRPNTALDMIGRIPGFSFDGGTFARGFSGTAGNVLIDGERPPSRSDSLGSILSRIPASAVVRIDIIRGGAEGIDMQGKAIIANVIRKKDAGLTGAVNGGINADTLGGGSVNGQIQVQDQREGRLLEGSLSGNSYQGKGNSFRDRVAPSGATILQATSEWENEYDSLSATGAYETTLWGGKVRVNGQANLNRSTYSSDETQVIPAGGTQASDSEDKNNSGELGVRFTRDISGYGVELVLFQSLEHGEATNIFNTSTFSSGGQSTEDGGESIARTTVRLPQFDKFTVETGAEAVYNWTESEDARILNGQVFPLPGDNFQADEMRAEGFVTLSWKPDDQINAELGGRYEWSRISADVSAVKSEKELSYFKPRLNVSWSPKGGHQFNLRVERTVDQLSFGGFASSASFENSVFGVGNPDIEPQKNWIYEVRYERQFGGQNSIVAKYTHQNIEDVLNRVIIYASPGPGSPLQPFEITRNIGEISRDALELSGTFELDRFGLKGGIANFGLTFRESETEDPVTHLSRRRSNDIPFGWNFNIQQTLDNGNFRWALFLEDDEDAYYYSPRSFGKQAQLMFIGANITWKPITGWTFGAGVNNILKNGNRGWSVFYSDGRNVGVPLYLERSLSEGSVNFFTNLRKNF